MPYWLSLLADVQQRAGDPDAARATLDAAIVAAHTHEDVWWLPEVLRMRAAFEADECARLERLRAASAVATEQGSVALLQRCERDRAELVS
jgi:hypothetical protein